MTAIQLVFGKHAEKLSANIERNSETQALHSYRPMSFLQDAQICPAQGRRPWDVCFGSAVTPSSPTSLGKDPIKESLTSGIASVWRSASACRHTHTHTHTHT